MEDIITFTGVVMIVFGILQIILFFKIWGMTNNVSKIKGKLEENLNDDAILLKAQLFALDGDKQQSFNLYKESFHKSIIELFNKTISEFGDKDNLDYKERNEYYKSEYKKVVKYYIKRVEKLGIKLDTEKFDSYEKYIHLYVNQYKNKIKANYGSTWNYRSCISIGWNHPVGYSYCFDCEVPPACS